MGRVFVVHDTGHDLSAAESLGKLTVLLKGHCNPNDPQHAEALREGLASFDPDRDALLCVGSPVFIGLAAIYAANASDDASVTYLVWDRHWREYKSVNIAAFPEGETDAERDEDLPA